MQNPTAKCLQRAAAAVPRLALMLAVSGLAAGCAGPWQKPAPPDPGKLRIEAEAAYEAGDWPTAVAGLKRVAEGAPMDASLHFRLGNALARAGRFDEAVAAYNQSLRLEPGQPKALHNRGIAHLRLARESLDQAANTAAAPLIAARATALARKLDSLLEADAP